MTGPGRSEHEAVLRAHGLRVTRGRLAVLATLAEHPHADADAIHRAITATEPSMSLQAVHNIVAALHAEGVIRRFEPARSAARFELRIGDNHHHAVCTKCGRVDDVDCVTGAAPCLHTQAPTGFTVTEAEVTFWGLCAQCSTA